jgi:hypothetical protein
MLPGPPVATTQSDMLRWNPANVRVRPTADYERVAQMVRQSLCEEADGFPLDLRQSELPGGGECLV